MAEPLIVAMRGIIRDMKSTLHKLDADVSNLEAIVDEHFNINSGPGPQMMKKLADEIQKPSIGPEQKR